MRFMLMWREENRAGIMATRHCWLEADTEDEARKEAKPYCDEDFTSEVTLFEVHNSILLKREK